MALLILTIIMFASKIKCMWNCDIILFPVNNISDVQICSKPKNRNPTLFYRNLKQEPYANPVYSILQNAKLEKNFFEKTKASGM